MENYFDVNGNVTNSGIFDRERMFKNEVIKIVSDKSVLKYTADSDIVVAYYTLQAWNLDHSKSHESIFRKLKK